MDSDRFIVLSLKVAQLIGMWPNEGTSFNNLRRFKIATISCIALLSVLLKVLLIPQIKNVTDVMRVFIVLPSYLMLPLKYFVFIMKHKDISALMNELKKLYVAVGSQFHLKYSKLPLIVRIQLGLVVMTPLMLTTDSINLAMNHKLQAAYWIPESFTNEEATFWFYFFIDRFLTLYMTIIVNVFELFVSLHLVHLKFIAELHATKLKSLNLLDKDFMERLKEVVGNHNDFRR